MMEPEPSRRRSQRRGALREAVGPPSFFSVERGESLPMVVRAHVGTVRLLDLVTERPRWVAELLEEHRALLFRGFDLPEEELGAVVAAMAPQGLLPCPDESTPRVEVAQRVFTSTSYPAHQGIPLHNEGGYFAEAPGRIYFYCATAAAVGGETPLGDVRDVARAIPEALKARFEALGVRYTRTYRDSFGLSWRKAFWTEDRSEVETYCHSTGRTVEWLPDGALRTSHRLSAFRTHPATGERLWHNHAAFFHPSSLDVSVRRALEAEFGVDGLPFYSSFGDGTPIADEDAAVLRKAYRSAEVTFPWQQGDLLLLDDFTVAHGRRPYEGSRRVLVALSHSHRLEGAPC